LWGHVLLASGSLDVALKVRVESRLDHLKVLRVTHLFLIVDLSSLALAEAQEGINFDLLDDGLVDPLRDFPVLNQPVVNLLIC